MSRSISFPRGPLALVLAWTSIVACGPTVGLEGSDTTGGATGSSDDVLPDPPPPPTSTTLPPPATTTTTTAPPDSSDVDTGSDFITHGDFVCVGLPDGTSAHCIWDCSVVDQDCPRGEKCVPWANDGGDVWNSTRCIPLDPDGAAPGEPCTMEGSPTSGLDDCDAVSMCWNVDPETLEGTCAPFCDPELAGACADGETCVEANDGVISICMPSCDPLVLDSCPSDQACLTIANQFVCVPSSDGNGGVSCDAELCSPGELCLPSGAQLGCDSMFCCTPWCDVTAPDPDLACAAVPGHTCQAYYPPGGAPEGFEHVGYCGVG